MLKGSPVFVVGDKVKIRQKWVNDPILRAHQIFTYLTIGQYYTVTEVRGLDIRLDNSHVDWNKDWFIKVIL